MKDNITNIYKKLPKKYLNECGKNKNPNYKKHLIKDPTNARFLLVGPSGSGKTQILLELLMRMSCTYYHVYLICKNKDQILYKYLEDALGENITIYESVDELPPHKELEPLNEPKFIIFDDCISESKKNLKIISDYFISARHSKCALAFLTQSFYDTPKILRLNVNYIMLRKIGNNRDLAHIIKTYSIKDINKEVLTKMYKYSTDGDDPNFLMIDLENPNAMFRRDFLEILNPSNFGYYEEI